MQIRGSLGCATAIGLLLFASVRMPDTFPWLCIAVFILLFSFLLPFGAQEESDAEKR